MKSFFQIVFATFLALLLFSVLTVLLGIGTLAGLMRLASKSEPKIASGSYLVVDLSANLTDAPPPSDDMRLFGRLLGGGDEDVLPLRGLLDAIHAAAGDDRIGGIFLHGSLTPEGYGSGFAALKEVREALVDFRKSSKKPVVAYLVDPTTRDYYLASAADTIYENPYGDLELPGLAAEPMFFKGALDKYGIGIEVVRHGKYKSAVEPYMVDKMSPESREQTVKLLNDIWGEFELGVARTRQITPEALQALVDKDGIIPPDQAKAGGLVTDLAFLPEVIEHLRQKAGTDETGGRHTFNQVDLNTYIEKKVGKAEPAYTIFSGKELGDDNAPRIAIVYAEGEIVDGEGDSSGMVGGDRYARVLRQLRQDDRVKGILLRINSPGGSGTASELIQHELALTRAAGKPVVVSMGTVAASGGYWISTASDRVFAEPNTITGSIGVFGMLPNVQGLANDHGVTFDEVKTGRLAGVVTISRPKTPEEFNMVQGLIDDFYKRFVTKVAESRKMTFEQVDAIAQGRVWSGSDALNLKLVDEIGGLETALAYLKTKVSLATNARVVEYPAPKRVAEIIADVLSGNRQPAASGDAALERELGIGPKSGPLGRAIHDLASEARRLTEMNDPVGAYARLPIDLRLR